MSFAKETGKTVDPPVTPSLSRGVRGHEPIVGEDDRARGQLGPVDRISEPARPQGHPSIPARRNACLPGRCIAQVKALNASLALHSLCAREATVTWHCS